MQKLGMTDQLSRLFALEGPPPDDPSLLRAYAQYRFEQTDYAGSKRTLLRALRVSRDDTETACALARFYLDVPEVDMRDPTEALVLAEHAVKQKPSEIRYWRVLADAGIAANHKDRSAEALRKILELNPKEADAAERLGKLEAELQ